MQFHTLLLEIGPAAAEKYTTPGQYLQVRQNGGKPGFYAIASTPEDSASGTVELLVRCRGENAEALCNIAAGKVAGRQACIFLLKALLQLYSCIKLKNTCRHVK